MVFAHKMKGILALSITMIVLLLTTMVMLATAKEVVTAERNYQHGFAIAQAQGAAQAGMNYALAFACAKLYPATTDGQVLSAAVSGTGSYVTTFTYLNGSDLVRVSSIGTSLDGTGTRTIQVILKNYPIAAIPSLPSTARGNFLMQGSSIVRNANGTQNLAMGGVLQMALPTATYLTNFSGPAFRSSWGTVTNGVATSGHIGSDVAQNQSDLLNYSDANFQTQYTGMLLTQFQNYADQVLSYSSNAFFNASFNSTGRLIYIDMNGHNATFFANFSVGEAGAPATLVIANAGSVLFKGNASSAAEVYGNVYTDGSLTITDNVTIQGMVFTPKDLTISGSGSNVRVLGAVAGGSVSGNVTIMNNAEVRYSAAILNETALKQYGVVPGSWKEF